MRSEPKVGQLVSKIQKMDGLNCKFCQRISLEFTILRCDHVVCAQCLWSEIKTSLAGTSSIRCPCGLLSNFTSKSILASPLATAHISSNASPRRYSSAQRPPRTETMTMSRKKQDTPNNFRKQSERKRELRTNQDFRRGEKENLLGRDDLGRELQFMGIQFRKSMEQVERNFKMVMDTLQKRFQNLVTNIRLFWLEEIVQSQPLQLLNISKLFQRKYHKAVGHKLKHLNDHLLDNIASYRLNTLQYQTVETDSWLPPKEGKQNRRIETNKIERQKLLRTIELMKEEGRGLKKMTKKNPRIKFL